MEPRTGGIHQSTFLQTAWRLQSDLTPQYGPSRSPSRFEQWQHSKGLTPVVGVNEVASILGKVQQIAQESYKKPWPESADEVDDTFFLLTEGLSAEVNHQMWFSGGFRFAALTVVNDSIIFRTLIERVLRFATEEYPNLKVSVFGKGLDFAQMDLYVTAGEGPNIIVSLGFVFAFYLIWLLMSNRRKQSPPRYRLRPIGGAFLMILPFLFGIGVVGILLWALQIPLSLSTAPLVDLTINASGDFSVYVIAAVMLELDAGKNSTQTVAYVLALRGVVVFTDFLLNATAFAPLLTSRFQPVREMGWLMDFMLFTCTIGALVFVPSALPLAVTEASVPTTDSHHEQ